MSVFEKFDTSPQPLSRSAQVFKSISALALLSMAEPVLAVFPETDLGAYYRDFPGNYDALSRPTSSRPASELLPRSDITGGGLGLSTQIVDGNNVSYVVTPRPYSPFQLVRLDSYRGLGGLTQFREGLCNGGFTFSNPPTAGSSKTFSENRWLTDGSRGRAATRYVVGEGVCDISLPTADETRRTTDELSFGAPVRRTAIDGSQYDASPLKLTRNGLPWYTHYIGYHLGLVANESNWDNANLGKAGDLVGFFRLPSPVNNFELVALPPPWVEDDVVEYVNKQDFPKQPVGQFFYAVLAADKAALDAVPAWQRTGKSFKSGGYVSVCRFYGGKNGGPNTHFYSADDKECAALKSVPVLSYEGQTFAVNMPMPGANADGTKPCPIDSKPLYRLYNNASAPGKDYVSNHRYVTERADVSAAVAQGWVDEGQVMCVPL